MNASSQPLLGFSYIAGRRGGESTITFRGVNPTNGDHLEPLYYEATSAEVDHACAAAGDAFTMFGQSSGIVRARLLREIAGRIETMHQIDETGQLETGLTKARLYAERARTCAQLRLFANMVEDGNWVSPRIDRAQPNRSPIPQPDIRSMHRPLGPVAVFCASNFPLAFSVAGGDTASALAAGCPVIVKAHHAHPGVAELVGQCVASAVASCDLPAGVFSLLYGSGRRVGHLLVCHPRIQAVGFTGSRSGGIALMNAAAARPVPIPVYAEMSSINPVIILPQAMEDRGAQIAVGLHASVTLGTGQFCTNPGVVFIPSSDSSDSFCTTLSDLMRSTPAQPMLHGGIRDSYIAGLAKYTTDIDVEVLVSNSAERGPGNCHVGAALYRISSESFASDNSKRQEVFGPSTLLVVYRDLHDVISIVEKLEGQLTATVHASPSELSLSASLIRTLEHRVGRIVFNGFPTGVEVCDAMVHGGPYPATSDGRSTSVGTLAIERFTRRVAWQSCPDELLPVELQDANPLNLFRLVDGKLER